MKFRLKKVSHQTFDWNVRFLVLASGGVVDITDPIILFPVWFRLPRSGPRGAVQIKRGPENSDKMLFTCNSQSLPFGLSVYL